ncbi:hypothetical protein [Paenibacillus arenosi]|uniref:SMI1/KNR4 family protein n=1 Tax=Paenibacillus arenosi TaxID=2774142 RepID=A0ABR9B3K9_9BACL|nr:hypothetical protein [Paenibacillus arenosi]MBD8500949.1 hypothetical protein [Paenibacillus arenosi]
MAKDVWDNILKHIETISQPIYSTVNPPATEEEIDLLESTLNVQLPSDFHYYPHEMDNMNKYLLSATTPFICPGYHRNMVYDE